MATSIETYELTTAPVTEVEMLIRRPVAEVFEAFVDPEITARFWFTRSSGKLEAGKQVRWDWEMYGVSAQVRVVALEPNQRILIEWANGDPSTVEWRFIPVGEALTFVSITHSDFAGDGDALMTQAIDSTGGFTLVLAGLKALLEHGVELNLVADRHPPEVQSRT